LLPSLKFKVDPTSCIVVSWLYAWWERINILVYQKLTMYTNRSHRKVFFMRVRVHDVCSMETRLNRRKEWSHIIINIIIIITVTWVDGHNGSPPRQFRSPSHAVGGAQQLARRRRVNIICVYHRSIHCW